MGLGTHIFESQNLVVSRDKIGPSITIFGTYHTTMDSDIKHTVLLMLGRRIRRYCAFYEDISRGTSGGETIASATVVQSGLQTVRAGDIVAYRAFIHEDHLIVHAYIHSKQSPKFYRVVICVGDDTLLQNATRRCECHEGRTRTGPTCSHVFALATLTGMIRKYWKNSKEPSFMKVKRSIPERMVIGAMQQKPKYRYITSASYLDRLYATTLAPIDPRLSSHWSNNVKYVYNNFAKKTGSWKTALGELPVTRADAVAVRVRPVPSPVSEWDGKSVAELKTVLRERGLKVSGCKAKLISPCRRAASKLSMPRLALRLLLPVLPASRSCARYVVSLCKQVSTKTNMDAAVGVLLPRQSVNIYSSLRYHWLITLLSNDLVQLLSLAK